MPNPFYAFIIVKEVDGNGHSNPISNPGCDCLPFTLHEYSRENILPLVMAKR